MTAEQPGCVREAPAFEEADTMKLFSRSKNNTVLDDVVIPARLVTLRVTKLFENVRALYRLMDDGTEKSDGEYILDVHYVSSLVEKVLERIHMIVHDVSVLAPESGHALYGRLAPIVKMGRDYYIDNVGERVARLRTAAATAVAPVEAEYVLLRQAMQWVTERRTREEPSITALLHGVFDIMFHKNVFAAIPCEEMPAIDVDTAHARNIVHVVNLDDGEEQDERAVTLEGLQSRPFELMVLGAEGNAPADDATNRPIRRWLAVVGPDSVHIARPEPDERGLLVVKQTGDPDADFIFALCGKGNEFERVASCEFRVERTGFGSVACIYDGPGENMDENLARMGQWLFGKTGGGPVP